VYCLPFHEGCLVLRKISRIKVLDYQLGWSLQHGHYSNPAAPCLQHTMNREHNNRCCNSTHSRKLLMMVVLMSETCWAHKKWNKIASDIKLVFYSSTNFSLQIFSPLEDFLKFSCNFFGSDFHWSSEEYKIIGLSLSFKCLLLKESLTYIQETKDCHRRSF